MKRQTILLLIATLPYICFSSTVYTPAVDSLLNLIEHAQGEELMELYTELHYALYELNDTELHLMYNQKHIDTALSHDDKLEERWAHTIKIEAMHNYLVADSVLLAEGWKVLKRFKELPPNDHSYFFVASTIVNYMAMNGSYEEALHLAERFYNEAKEENSAMGTITMLSSMEKAYSYLKRHNEAEAINKEIIGFEDNGFIQTISIAYDHLTKIYIEQERLDEALEYCRKFEEFLKYSEEHSDYPKSDLETPFFINKIAYANVYLQLGEYAQCEKYLKQAEIFPRASTVIGLNYTEPLRFELLRHQGKYEEAEKVLDWLTESCNKADKIMEHILHAKRKAEFYSQTKKYEKAVDAYKAYIVLKDSFHTKALVSQLTSLRSQYEIDKVTMQKEEQRRFFRNTIIWLLIVVALLCVIITIITINTRRLQAKNHILLQRIKQQDEIEKKNEQIRDELARTELAQVNENEEEGKLAGIYLRLKELMENPDVFTSPGINRKTIAEKLDTNEKYVFDTIREYYGVSISDYINALRLNYARAQLALVADTRTIEAIALDAGFNSRSTFYKLFKEQYGMTPVEFRKIANR